MDDDMNEMFSLHGGRKFVHNFSWKTSRNYRKPVL